MIAVLAALSIVGYTAVQARAVDSQRSTNVANVVKVLASSQVNDDKYLPEIFLSDRSMKGGFLSVENVARLNENGLDPAIMRNPGAPDGIANSFVFNDSISTTEGAYGRLSELPDNAKMVMYLPKETPTGFDSWDDFWNEYYDSSSEFWTDYYNSHPYPDNPEDEQAWYDAYEAAFAAEFPDLIAIADAGDSIEVEVSKTSIYIVDVLGATAEGDGYCNFEYSGEDYPTYQCTGPRQDTTWGHIPVTGMRITYYSQASGQWIQKQTGSGNAFGDYENYG